MRGNEGTIQKPRDDLQVPTPYSEDFMNQPRFRTLILLSLLAVGMSAAPSAPAAEWKPTRPINLIVPWAAGGSTDQVTRVDGRRAREGAGPDDRHRQPARRVGVDRHQERARRAQGRLHLDRRRRAGPRRLRDARLAEDAHHRLEPLPQRRQRPGHRRQPEDAVQDAEGAARRDEGQAGPDLGRDRRRHLGRPQRDGS